jgi:hypothetical protein
MLGFDAEPDYSNFPLTPMHPSQLSHTRKHTHTHIHPYTYHTSLCLYMQSGFPNYKEGGTNTVELELRKTYSASFGNICAGRVEVTVLYY